MKPREVDSPLLRRQLELAPYETLIIANKCQKNDCIFVPRVKNPEHCPVCHNPNWKKPKERKR